MYISIKYVIFYTGIGFGAGFIADGDKRVAVAGIILSAIMGYSFGFDYALISAVEFGAGFLAGAFMKNKRR